MDLQGRDLKLDMRGDDVALLHRELTLIGFGAALSAEERRKSAFGPSTHGAVSSFQKERGMEVTGVVDSQTARAINAVVEADTITVEGRIASRTRAGVGRLQLEIVDKNVGEDVVLAAALTDDGGRYRTAFSIAALRQRGKQQPDLQARVLSTRPGVFLGVSEVRYNASKHETLNILLGEGTDGELASEYETLVGALATHFGGSLSALKEDDRRQDITYLANKTGWDARAVAMGALAAQHSERTVAAGGTRPAIAPAFFYALFRAGLPANEDAVYQINAKTAAAIWKRAIGEGLIPAALADSIPQAVEHFQSLAAKRALDVPALPHVSSLKEMLSVSLGDDVEKQRQFADLYTRHQDDPPQFWKAVRSAFGEPAEQRLKLDGQLAYLTLNNASLIRKLHNTVGQNSLRNTLQLVENGFSRARRWREVLGDDPVPPEIPGANAEEKRARYAELLAAQVRLGFPTAVVAQLVESGEMPLAATPEVRKGVHTFLTEHDGKFDIGMQPIERYLVQNNLPDPPDGVKAEIKRIQRVYQITPSDTAMNALLKKKLYSAYDVVRYDRAEFVETFKEELGGEAQAKLAYAKAEQVHTVALGIATSYALASRAPGIGGLDQGRIINSAPRGSDPQAANPGNVIAYPTLEGLFGAMDFCECEHCRSILSPAAYLVDLLLFCDRPINEKENPQKVLLERRPDIQHLPLTCENTNTPLPYIDVVNETLEYFVTNNLTLDDYAGHSIDGDASPEELLASPQFVGEAAYETLKTETFPPPLPFHQPLENLRRYFDRFGVPLPEVMEVLRKDDSVERANPNEYGWRDILMEELRLSRAEYALLTDRTLTLQQLYGYAPATSEADVLTGLANAKAFTRRLGITYEEIIEILKARFINPSSTLIPKLERLSVPFATLKAFKDGAVTDADFDALLPPALGASQYGGDIKAWVKDDANFANIMGLITLSDPTAAADLCSFDKLEFRYANPDNNANQLRAFEYVRLIRFIRLWKKLGWTIEQTDKAITALYPEGQHPNDPDDTVNLERLDAGFLILLPRLGVIKRLVRALKLGNQDLLPLLACFAPIDTHGALSLYRKMFLSPALLKLDAAFADDGFGNFLTDNTQSIAEHEQALRAAFLLTDTELNQIMRALGFDANSLLNMDNISAVFRHGWLARKLRISVREFLLLAQFTGLDPFAAPDPPHPPMQRLIESLERIRAARLKPEQALYLIWNQDISGRSAPDDRQILDFAGSLRAGFAAIESEFAIADDPEGQIARAKMALVFDNEATDFFFGLLGNTFVTDVAYSHDQTSLEQPILDVAPAGIAYDDLRKRLSYRGVLTVAVLDALKAVAGVSAQFQSAMDNLFEANQLVVGPFFNRYPELLQLYDAYVASNDPTERKRSDLLANFLPTLKRRRKLQQALQAITTAAKTDLGFTSALLDDPAVLHAAGNNDRPALDDLTAMETAGLSARFFFRDTATGNIDRTSDAEANLAYTATGTNRLPANPVPGGTISGIWSGHIEVPENGPFNLRIEADAGATVALTVDGRTATMASNGTVWSNTTPIELRAGILYAIIFKVEKVRDTVSVRWESAGRGREVIPSRYLYSATLLDQLRSVYILFLKAAALASTLRLTAAETVHFASHADYWIGDRGWLNSLPVTGSPNNETAAALLKVFTALLDFARIKSELAPDDERLLSVLEDAAAATQGPDSLLFTLTRWTPDSLAALLLIRFGKVFADLVHFDTFRRVYDAHAPMRTLGISAPALINATTNEPNALTVRDLQAALRARYDEGDWLSVLKPINDEMRRLQRGALVTYILHQMRQSDKTQHIDTPDKLFEYFLIDVQMDPCMQTSRIRHALSSVQLFIERCLMNLEPDVAPSSIKAKQWEWIKRYRVWEANRKVFLWPENWLEPELRDNQSPFFRETMSELLQGDITEDRAATALLNYLSKLEEVAKLEPCGIHYLENDPTSADDIAHVVARTAGANRKYFYRRREYGYWMPWVQIRLEIEDNPVIPVVWNDRLLLFWLKILMRAPISPQAMSTSSSSAKRVADLSLEEIKDDAKKDAQKNTKITIQAVLCWSEYYNGKWQPTKTSDVNHPAELGKVHATDFDRTILQLSVSEEAVCNALRVDILGYRGSSFLLFNTHSLPITEPSSLLKGPARHLNTSTDELTATYIDGPFFLSRIPARTGKLLTRPILRTRIADRVTEPRHELQNIWDAPFLYEDSRHVFYVTSGERIVLIREWDWYGIIPDVVKPVLALPRLVFEPAEVIPDRYGPFVAAPNVGVVDRDPIGTLVSEDAYIDKAIGTTGTVRFADRDIGPVGAVSNRQRRD